MMGANSTVAKAALVGREPGRGDTAVAGEGGRFSGADQQAQREQQGDRGAAGHEAGRAGEQCEHRPQEDAEEVGDLRAEAVQQPAARQLGQHIGPGEGREHEAHLHGVQAQRFLDFRTGDRDGGAVGVVDGGDGEQNGENHPAGAGLHLGSAGCIDGLCLFHKCLLMSIECPRLGRGVVISCSYDRYSRTPFMLKQTNDCLDRFKNWIVADGSNLA
jgi:hypothetical protein